MSISFGHIWYFFKIVVLAWWIHIYSQEPIIIFGNHDPQGDESSSLISFRVYTIDLAFWLILRRFCARDNCNRNQKTRRKIREAAIQRSTKECLHSNNCYRICTKCTKFPDALRGTLLWQCHPLTFDHCSFNI